MESDKKLITIKRYSNRKLYDTSQSRYITLTELGELIRCGANIVVIDNDTKADLTDVTLTQVLITQQKQKQKGIRGLVQNQAEILLQRLSVPVQQIRDEALRQVEKQVEKLRRMSDPAEADRLKEAENQAGAESKTSTADSSHDSTGNPDAAKTTDCSPDTQRPVSSLDLKLEALKSSSDEKLLSLILVQRLEELENEVTELKRRLELLEQKDDDTY